MPKLQAPEYNVPKSAARHYRAHAHDMASAVSRRLAQHEQFNDFLGDNPVRLLNGNHHNHAAFLAEILETNHYSLLARSLPWLYAAYHHQGVPFEYFLAELELWREVIREVLPAEAAAAVLPVYEWMIQVHPQTVLAAQAHQAARLDIPTQHQTHCQRLLEYLLRGQYAEAIHYSRELLHGGMSYQCLQQNVIYPMMVEVGARWEQGELSVAMEHQTTAMVYGLLATLYQEQDVVPTTGGRAIVAPVTQEFHQLGAWTLATHLELEGWDVTLLNSPVSADALTENVLSLRPHIVALSVTLVGNVQAARELVVTLRQVLTEHHLKTRIALGGQAFSVAPDLAETIAADVYLRSADECIEWLRHVEIEP